MSTTEPIIGFVLPDPGTPGIPGSGDIVDGNVLNANWTKAGKYAGAKTSQTAVASVNNSTFENTLASGLVLPNPSVVGTAFRFRVWGNVDHAAVATNITYRFYLGTQVANQVTFSYPASALTNQQFVFDWEAVCVTAGAAGTWEAAFMGNVQTNNVRNPTADMLGAPVAQNLSANFIKFTAQFSVANAGHTCRVRSSVSYWTKAV